MKFKLLVVAAMVAGLSGCTSFKLYNYDPAGFTDIELCKAVGYALAVGDRGRALRVVQEGKRRDANHTATISEADCKAEAEITQAEALQSQQTLGIIANQLGDYNQQQSRYAAAQIQQMNQINQANTLSSIDSHLRQQQMDQQMRDFRNNLQHDIDKFSN